ncbi:MAG: MMPL family transporter, partial [Planctomycetes bacterium]|nr:MMPL family transporter [Planctomycetota bacterium]
MSVSSDEPHTESRLALASMAGTAWIARHPWLTITFCLVTVVIAIHQSFTRLTYRTQRGDLMSADHACQARWRNYLREFGEDDDIVFVIEGKDGARMQAAIDKLADRLRAEPELFDRVLAKDQAFLDQIKAIVATAEKSLDEPTRYSNPWQSFTPQIAGRDDILQQPRYSFSDDGTLAMLPVRPAMSDRQSFTPVARSVDRSRAIIRETSGEFPDLSFGLTGLPVLENDEMAGTDRDSMRAAWLALAGVALLYLVVYRGLRYPLLTVGTLLVGTVWALGLTALTIGHLNILSSAFAVMLIGMGDYGVLWVARFD